ncbi:MAG: sensor histidine kinase [Sporichthyaceae bacterium]
MRARLSPMVEAAVPALGLVSVFGAAAYHAPFDADPPSMVLSAAACLALAARRAQPTWTVAATLALVAPVVVLDRQLAAYALLVPAAALLSFAIACSRLRRVLGGVGFLALVVFAETINPNRPGLAYTAQHVAQIVVAIVIAEMLRTRRDYRSVLGERLTLLNLTREQETQQRLQEDRLRIARDLHDVVAHTLTTINVQASVAGHLLDTRPEQARHALAVIEEASRDGIDELRAILGVLRSSEVGASMAPTPGIDEVSDLVDLARDAGLRAQFDVSGERPPRLSEAVSHAAYRIVQESLTNAARHSTAANVYVRVAFAREHVQLTVVNASQTRANGSRPLPTDSSGASTFTGVSSRVGIVGMTERAEAVGGTLTARQSAYSFLVSARLPYRAGGGE